MRGGHLLEFIAQSPLFVLNIFGVDRGIIMNKTKAQNWRQSMSKHFIFRHDRKSQLGSQPVEKE